MNAARVKFELNNGEVHEVRREISDRELTELSSLRRNVRARAESALFHKTVRAVGMDFREVHAYRVQVLGRVPRSTVFPSSRPLITKEPVSARGKVERCHSILRMANLALPPRVRDEALDEWIDDIECAAAEKKPVLKRTLWIVFRSLPSLALRARLPRARRERGS